MTERKRHLFDEAVMGGGKGLIVPIHKKGDTTDPNNYRGITLISTFTKIFSLTLSLPSPSKNIFLSARHVLLITDY